MEMDIEYQGNDYKNFYFFPKPDDDNYLYNKCQGYIAENAHLKPAGKTPHRSMRTHTCFNSCSDYGDCLTGFDLDNRPTCRSEQGQEEGIVCINPYLETCENYVEPNMFCINNSGGLCFDWRKILIAILIANAL
jgi:hypothetical protein